MTGGEIYEILGRNGMRVSSDFADLDRRGYDSDEAQRFSEELVEKLGYLVAHGVNNGFNGSMKDTIDLLTDMILSMNKRKITEKIGRLRTRADEAVARTKLTRADGADVRAPVMEFITSTLAGAEIMAEREADDERVTGFAEKSRKILLELREALSGVINVTSIYAAQYAEEIIKRLRVWRNSASTRQFDSVALDSLSAAVNEAVKWKGLVVKGEHVRADKIPSPPADDFGSIVGSNAALEALGGLRAELRRKTAAIEKLESERSRLLDERRKSREELDGIVREWQNGALDDETADMRSQYAEQNIARIDEELIPVETRISSERSVLGICRRLENSLAVYENDPIMLHKLALQVDFGRVNSFLMGHLDAADGSKLVDDIDLVISVELRRREETMKIGMDYKDIIDKKNEEWRRLGREINERVVSKTGQKSDARERMLRRMGTSSEKKNDAETERIDLTRESADPTREDL